jgi:hypothetical protein
MGLASTLTVVFIVLKLTHLIDWSWWAVLSPTLIDLAIGVLLLTGVAVFGSRKPRRKYERRSRWGN